MAAKNHKKIAIFSSIIAVIATVIAVLSNIASIAQWLGVEAPNLRINSPPDAIIDSVLLKTETFQRVTFDAMEDLINSLEQNAENAKTFLERQSAYLVAGQLLEASGDYRKALHYFRIASELNTRLGDPYYAIGNLYYDLALIDLIFKRRFIIDSDKLTCSLEPDEDTKKILSKVTQEYNSGDLYPLIHDITKSQVIITSLHIVEHRRRQIVGVMSGNPSIGLHRLEMMRLVVWVPAAYPKDKKLTSNIMTLSERLFRYAADHPNEFVGLLPLKGLTEKNESN